MIIKTYPVSQIPDVDKIRDELTKQFNKDFADILLRTIRNIYDDIVALEKTERVTAFPTADLGHRGKTILVEGTSGGADGLFICADTGGLGFAWKTISLT